MCTNPANAADLNDQNRSSLHKNDRFDPAVPLRNSSQRFLPRLSSICERQAHACALWHISIPPATLTLSAKCPRKSTGFWGHHAMHWLDHIRLAAAIPIRHFA